MAKWTLIYCKFQQHCQKQQVNVDCPDIPNCNNDLCFKRHPKACKNYAKYKKCRFQQCAYSHKNNLYQSKVEKLEKVGHELKLEVEELKKNKTDTNNKFTILSEQVFEIRNNLKDIVTKTKCMKSDEGDAMNKIRSNKEDDDKSKKAALLQRQPLNQNLRNK